MGQCYPNSLTQKQLLARGNLRVKILSVKKVFELQAAPEDLAAFRPKLRILLQATGMDEIKSGETVLAVDEALTNIYRHAYQNQPGKIHLCFQDEKNRVEILIRNWGIKFDPTQAPPPQLPPVKPGGLGIHLIKNLMDQVAYNTGNHGENQLRLIKYKKGRREDHA